MTVEDDLLAPGVVADPYAYLARLRSEDPVHWSERYRSWVLTRHEHVSAAMTDTSFSSDRIVPVIEREKRRQRPDLDLIRTLELLDGWLVFRDPPEHTRFRRLVHRGFSPRIIAGMQAEVEKVADDLIDAAGERLAAGETIDLIGEVAYPLPAMVIASMLGVPPQDRDLFKDWSDDISALVFGALEDPDRHDRARQGMDELVAYIGGLLERVADEPGDNLASSLVAARDGDETLTMAELIATCVNLLFGGHETTTNLLANGVLALVRHPDQAQLLRDDPELIGPAIEELLRYDGPAKAVVRIARTDVELGGRQIKAGDRVFAMLSAANHDPEAFPSPETLDIQRKRGPHVSFGVGIHYCLGAALARLEASIVIPRILTRFPTLVVKEEELSWDPVILTRGLERLPVRLGDLADG